MSMSRRIGLTASRNLVRQSARRNASSHGPDKHTHTGPKTSTFGKGTYGTLAAIPAFYFVYTLSRPSADGTEPAFTRYLRSFDSWQKQFAERNATHTAMLDQAAKDKLLFYQHKPSSHYDLKYSGWFNEGSPYNVPAGFYMNVDKVIAHYEEENRKTGEKILEKMEKAKNEEQKLFWAAENTMAAKKEKSTKLM